MKMDKKERMIDGCLIVKNEVIDLEMDPSWNTRTVANVCEDLSIFLYDRYPILGVIWCK